MESNDESEFDNQAAQVILRGVNDQTLACGGARVHGVLRLEEPGGTRGRQWWSSRTCARRCRTSGRCQTPIRGLRHAVCELLLTRAAKVYVVESDGLRQTAWEAFEVSGYRRLEALGATLVNLSEAEQMEVEVPPAGRVTPATPDADQRRIHHSASA